MQIKYLIPLILLFAFAPHAHAAIRFDGTTSYASSTFNKTGATSFSMEATFYAFGSVNGLGIMAISQDKVGNRAMGIFTGAAGAMRCFINQLTTNSGTTVPDNIVANKWYHVRCALEEGLIKTLALTVYNQDGSVFSSSTNTTILDTQILTPLTTFVGKSNDNGQFCACAIRDVFMMQSSGGNQLIDQSIGRQNMFSANPAISGISSLPMFFAPLVDAGDVRELVGRNPISIKAPAGFFPDPPFIASF